MEKTNTLPLGKNLNNINFFRIFFTLMIVYGHIIQHFMIPLYGTLPFFARMQAHVSYAFGYMCDMFFIISGFFMFFSFHKYKTFFDFITAKIIRLLPILLASLLFVYFLSSIFTDIIFYKYQDLLALLFLNNALIANFATNNGAAWYINSLVWGYIFYYCLIKASPKNTKYIIGIIVFFAYSLLLNKMELYAQPQVWLEGLISIPMIRSIAGLGLGYLIGEWFSNRPNKESHQNIWATLFYTVLEGFILVHIFRFAIIKFLPFNFVNMLVLFIILFFLFLTKKGYLSRFLDSKIIFQLGKYCFSIYMMQEVMFHFLVHTFWKEKGFIAAFPQLTLGISVLVICLFGVAMFYLVEMPSTFLLKRLIKKQDSAK